ncbi:hypothetical protein BCD67_22090 [Oscillatoriales cyanobacterium USR001]|nr:hypothetical protein BCD67_22090 [Oscillatoriales cyanobacterium USR001]
MVKISEHRLITAEELPHSDDTPVDNELQNLIPNLLLSMLLDIWRDRDDWFFAVDMAVYYESEQLAIVPNGFLALGVSRNTGDRGRLSYLIWQENDVVPILTLEIVSHKYNSEYQDKLQTYQQLGVLYYVVYNSFAGSRGRHKNRQELEIYKLVNQQYELVSGNPIWMPEIGLGIGSESYNYANWERNWLFWYDREGNRYLTEREKNERERLGREQERQAKEKLAAYLRGIGINPDEIA